FFLKILFNFTKIDATSFKTELEASSQMHFKSLVLSNGSIFIGYRGGGALITPPGYAYVSYGNQVNMPSPFSTTFPKFCFYLCHHNSSGVYEILIKWKLSHFVFCRHLLNFITGKGPVSLKLIYQYIGHWGGPRGSTRMHLGATGGHWNMLGATRVLLGVTGGHQGAFDGHEESFACFRQPQGATRMVSRAT
ncbi:unnamed protein product, partial [Owenia fusiformis]